MKKTFILFFLCLLFLVVNFGFKAEAQTIEQITNAFRICRYETSEGKISLSYIFPVNSKELSEILTDQEISEYKFFLSMYVNALAKSNSQKEIEGIKVENCVYFEDLDGLGFSIIFENSKAQNIFFGSGENSSKSEQKTSGFFIKKIMLTTNFPISIFSADNLREICSMALEAWSKENSVSLIKKDKIKKIISDAVFIYDYATQDEKLKSDVMYKENDFYHNYFQKNYEQLSQENKINFWIVSPNRPIWYLSALVIVGVFMIIASFWRKKTKKT